MKRIIDRLRIDRRIRVGYGTAFFILLISYVITLTINSKAVEQAELLKKSNNLITRLDIYLSVLKDADLGFKGFIISGDKSRLDLYNRSRNRAGSYFYAIFPDPLPQDPVGMQMNRIKSLSDKKFAKTDSAIALFRTNGNVMNEKVLVYETDEEKNAAELREIIKEIQISERNRLSSYTKALAQWNDLMNNTVIISLVLALFLFVFAFITYFRENKARHVADVRAEEYSDELEKRIEELNEANLELKEMRRMEKFTTTGRIARTIAHEVRNPLTNINLSVEHLKAEPDLPFDNRIDFYDMIVRNSQRINGLITTLLNATAVSELKAQNNSINTLLDETLQLAEDRLKLHEIKLVKNYNPDICDVNVDREKVKIALLNIIVNAIEAMEAGRGVLTVETASRAGKCLVRIADNGRGMDEETINRLFEPYYTKKSGGTGLGLTNAANIILSHKGDIQVNSQPGQGTAFEITLDFAP